MEKGYHLTDIFEMVQIPASPLTLDKFLQIPETKPASEFIDGQIFQKPMPQGQHSRLQRKLLNLINLTAEPKNIAEAFPELRCTFGGRSIVPDIAVVFCDRIPVDDRGDIANAFNLCPDWTIEILSPDQSATKVIDNILHCLENGCTMGWLINPQERSVIVHPAERQPKIFRQPEALILVPAFMEEIKLTPGELFHWLQVTRS
jgi:Uma2 family endonuclease